jgi:hypothetical protein
MHFKSLLHVRDHVKVQGRAYDLLMYIALHTNMHTGEAFELTIARQALRHQLTPEWTRILLNGVIATGELIVERSRGRHPNRYRFPLERCHACQGEDLNPEVELGDAINPKLYHPQPQTRPPPSQPEKSCDFQTFNPKLRPGKKTLKTKKKRTLTLRSITPTRNSLTPSPCGRKTWWRRSSRASTTRRVGPRIGASSASLERTSPAG